MQKDDLEHYMTVGIQKNLSELFDKAAEAWDPPIKSGTVQDAENCTPEEKETLGLIAFEGASAMVTTAAHIARAMGAEEEHFLMTCRRAWTASAPENTEVIKPQ